MALDSDLILKDIRNCLNRLDSKVDIHGEALARIDENLKNISNEVAKHENKFNIACPRIHSKLDDRIRSNERKINRMIGAMALLTIIIQSWPFILHIAKIMLKMS